VRAAGIARITSRADFLFPGDVARGSVELTKWIELFVALVMIALIVGLVVLCVAIDRNDIVTRRVERHLNWESVNAPWTGYECQMATRNGGTVVVCREIDE